MPSVAGLVLGTAVGVLLGAALGEADGPHVAGASVGPCVSPSVVGLVLGTAVGVLLGAALGAEVVVVGAAVGAEDEGRAAGAALGAPVADAAAGADDGAALGPWLRAAVGSVVETGSVVHRVAGGVDPLGHTREHPITGSSSSDTSKLCTPPSTMAGSVPSVPTQCALWTSHCPPPSLLVHAETQRHAVLSEAALWLYEPGCGCPAASSSAMRSRSGPWSTEAATSSVHSHVVHGSDGQARHASRHRVHCAAPTAPAALAVPKRHGEQGWSRAEAQHTALAPLKGLFALNPEPGPGATAGWFGGCENVGSVQRGLMAPWFASAPPEPALAVELVKCGSTGGAASLGS